MAEMVKRLPVGQGFEGSSPGNCSIPRFPLLIDQLLVLASINVGSSTKFHGNYLVGVM